MKIQKLSLILGVLSAGGAMAASSANRILVKYRDGAELQAMTSSARLLGHVAPMRQVAEALMLVRYSTNLTPQEAAREAAADPRVEWAQPDYLLSLPTAVVSDETAEFPSVLPTFMASANALMADPSPVKAPNLPSTPIADPQMGELWGMDRIQAPAAWKLNSGSRNILVADIDTGIDYNHEDLVNNLWSKIGYDFVGNDALPWDDNQHGTHTAGTIGATGGNGKGVSGVSPQVTIMALRFIGSEGFGTTSDAIRAIDFAIANGARIMSNSWGGPADDSDPDNPALVEAVKRAGKADILFVAAAGNDGTDNDTTPMFPASIDSDNVLAVAATSEREAISFYSNYGLKSVDVAAPGSGILSSVPGGSYKKFNGTSMACPHVAGLAALLLSENPKLSAVELKRIIMDTVDPVASLQGKTVTGGRINALRALEAVRLVAR